MAATMANGARLFYAAVGDAEPPLVLVHGSWIDHHGWDRVVPLLSSQHRVIAYDRRGYGRSERPRTQGSVAEDVADLAALIESLEVGPVHVAGGSFGATIALRLTITRPDLVLTVAAQEPPLFDMLRDHPVHEPVMREIKRRIAAVASRLAVGEIEEGARLFMESAASGPGTWEQLPPAMRQSALEHALTFLDETRDPEWCDIDLDALTKVTCPVLLTRGGRSLPWFAPVVACLAAAMPAAEVREFPDAGHPVMMTHPEEYAAALSRFITVARARPTGGRSP